MTSQGENLASSGHIDSACYLGTLGRAHITSVGFPIEDAHPESDPEGTSERPESRDGAVSDERKLKG